MVFKVILEPAEEGGYVVHCPALKGCWSQGETVEEALENIKDAIEGYIESLKKHGESVPDDKEKAYEYDVKVAV